jgi:hypothetical protein
VTFGRRFAIHLAERLAVEGVIERLRRTAARDNEEPDMVLFGVFITAPVVLPVYLGAFAWWVLTGRGPACRVFAVNRGEPRRNAGGVWRRWRTASPKGDGS